ncbi:hypothetical protein FGG08_006771 [Glutinoglossum americanum]|uniref:Pachytene checkpoint protein 2 C-terminal domain-containing protein n=1 Tax=Glutinoglossum americanum TaxID=1670608 RepID=A0A9P8HVL6_9PEZI|nr:hypothetical protein FGG08_006771 [Glutinoglossum americanum]
MTAADQLVAQWLADNFTYLSLDEDFTSFKSMSVVECTGSPPDTTDYRLCDVDLKVHTYRLEENSTDSTSASTLGRLRAPWNPDTLAWEEIDSNSHHKRAPEESIDEDERNTSKIASVRLPSKAFVGLWESLIYDTPIPARWFGGSAKLVNKLFEGIEDLVDEEEDTFVCILIDEIESLTGSRQSTASRNEPADSMRDSAFLDRVDIKQFIPEPSAPAAYSILRTCLVELQRCGIIWHLREKDDTTDTGAMSVDEPQVPNHELATLDRCNSNAAGTKLLAIAERCKGISGRKLRRLPVLAHSCYIQHERCSIHEFLSALAQAVEDEVGPACA